MQLVTIEEILIIHDTIVQETGGSMGIREPGLLVAITEKPRANFEGKELYPTIYDKVATTFEALCNYHVFVDGNKRSAIATLEYFLFKNGFSLKATAAEKEDFVLSTAKSHPDLADMATWIKKHSKKDTK
ncbi:MAG: type II toxin-antitoxin system death-on-curing family toxin [Actinobacteria bacterium]|nr:type II toxin-antitoxin system death-on-curing family toxin [Actinomycetota bacterium]